MEMLLVLAVLAVFAAAAWPAVTRFYGDYQLKDAVERVRVRLSATRLRAIDQGRTFQFCFEPEGTQFVAFPLQPPAPAQSAGGQAASPRVSNVPLVTADELGEGLQFQNPPDTAAAAYQLSAQHLAGSPDASRLAGVTWSQPILFHADGSATDGLFRIVDDKGQYVEFFVRGLTGTASSSSVEQEER